MGFRSNFTYIQTLVLQFFKKASEALQSVPRSFQLSSVLTFLSQKYQISQEQPSLLNLDEILAQLQSDNFFTIHDSIPSHKCTTMNQIIEFHSLKFKCTSKLLQFSILHEH
ncbi:hypothetical protein ACKWTF_008852 [Chironomus riparius]